MDQFGKWSLQSNTKSSGKEFADVSGRGRADPEHGPGRTAGGRDRRQGTALGLLGSSIAVGGSSREIDGIDRNQGRKLILKMAVIGASVRYAAVNCVGSFEALLDLSRDQIP